ncbi:altered inheritance of mitochondria protein 3-like [Fagus crenata]
METDSGGDQVGDSLDFVLDFDFDDEDLLHNPNSPMTSTHLPGETLGNLSVQEYVELGSSSGSNQPLINQTYQTNPNHNFTMSTITTSDLSNIPLEHAENLAQPAPPFNSPLIGTQQCYHPTIDNGELGSPGGHSQPQLNQENPNSNHSQHAYSENPGPPVVNTPSLPQMVPSSFNTTVVGGTQPYPPSMVGMIAPDGAHQSFHLEHEANLIYPNQLMNAQPEHMPVPQSNEFMTANVFDPQYYMLPQAYALLRYLLRDQDPIEFFRPQSFLYHQLNQVRMPPNVYDPQVYNYNSMLPELSYSVRLQQSYGHQQPNQFATLMPNVFIPQVSSSMLPEQIMLSGPPQLMDHYEQANQVSMAPYASNPQQPNPTTPAPSIQPWPQGPQQSSEHHQLNKVPAMAHRVDLPHDKILPPESSIPSRPSKPKDYRIKLLDKVSPTLLVLAQEIVNPKTKVTLPNLCETSLGSSKEKGAVEGRRCAAKRHVSGESSVSSKRSRKETVRKEKSLPTSSAQEEDMSSQSEETEVENPNVSSPSEKRQVKNSLYDPIFEGIGQPIDPHLRLFSSSKEILDHARSDESTST